MKQFNVTGMSCAACSARVEKAVNNVPGVDKCAVSLLTNSMGVEGSAKDEEVIKAVEKAGYGASVKGKGGDDNSLLVDTETPKARKRLVWSIIFLALLMYMSMGHMMWGWPLPSFYEGQHVLMGITQMILTIIIMVINRKFFISGFGSVIHGAPNMDTLVALGSGTAFGYSVFELVRMYQEQIAGNQDGVMYYMENFYFESAAMILTLIAVGKMLESRSKGRTTDALKSLMSLAPKTATLMVNGKEKEVPIEQVSIGDVFTVKPGENIPVDGIVEEGISAVNEAALTGESIPVDKGPGDKVSAATTNTSGHLLCQATRVGEDTTLSQIIKMVSDAAATKAPIARIADKVSGIFVPVVISIAIIVLIIWLLCGVTSGVAVNYAISVLVISCPCALGLATPVAIMVGNGMGARRGILFKTAVSLEETGKVSTVVLDKTGTVTRGEPIVVDVIPAPGVEQDKLIQLAYSLEVKSEHPLAKAIVAYAKASHVRTKKVDDFKVLTGNGLMGTMDGDHVCGGNLEFINHQVDVHIGMKDEGKSLATDGKTPLYFSKGHQLMGIIAVADQVKDDSASAISQIKELGVNVIMLTGDNGRTATAVGRQVGIEKIYASVLPSDKERVVRELGKTGTVAMVGDGINDAPALTRADVGIAIGAGTDVAIDAADIVLMNSSLSDVAAAIRLSRATLRNIHENLFWAFIYNVFGIPLAAGALVVALGISLNPMIAAACMSLSSFCVVSNALRLNLFKMDGKKTSDSDKRPSCDVATNGDKILNSDANMENALAIEVIDLAETREMNKEKTMEKTLKIEGMMCQHCEARVKQTLEGFDQVDQAIVSHEDDKAVITLNDQISDDELQKAIADQGYTVLSIEN